jgi:hypothetical protein
MMSFRSFTLANIAVPLCHEYPHQMSFDVLDVQAAMDDGSYGSAEWDI